VVHCAAVVAIEARRAHEVRDTNLRAVELVVGGAAERGDRSDRLHVEPGRAVRAGRSALRALADRHARERVCASKAEGEAYVRELQRDGARDPHRLPARDRRPRRSGISEGNHTIRAFLRELMVDTSSGFEIVDVRDLAALIAALVEPSAARAAT
jgi:hypothetical protein